MIFDEAYVNLLVVFNQSVMKDRVVRSLLWINKNLYWHWQSIKNKFNKALANQFVVIRYLQLKLLMSCHRGKLTPDECKIFFPIKVDTKKIFFVMRIPEWQTLAQMIYLKNNGKLVNVIHQRNCLLSSCIKKSLISSLHSVKKL